CIRDSFFTTVDSLFGETGKKIAIDPTSNTLVFRIGDGSSASHDDMIQLEQLSSGEKQMLLILTTVFLQEEKPNILLMDEPEISLHIGWQDRLISMIRKLNPQCQLILTTHSPNIFADGWEDKIVFMNDLVVK
ncbi:MAG: ATP-binding protein, partial [bacterium]|nr:ATP-binding protein [Candidatus Aphodosoma intestinipullorum]